MTDTLATGHLTANDPEGRRPMMVVDDVHIDYQVYASGKRVGARDNSLFSMATLRGGRDLKTVPALRGVTFTAGEGETIGVVGHNGSGKSTLFKAMSGLIPASQGRILARDRPVLLGVNAALVPELSGENNIKLGLLAMGFTPEEAAAQVDEIADFAELNEFISHPMRTYSSGMAARLRFAIASARAHSILLIDEALAVGDRRFKVKSEARIRDLRDSAGLVMIVSHSAGALRDSCERVLWIHKGELIADGPAGDVIDDYVAWTKQPGSNAVGAASAAARPSARNAPTADAASTSAVAAPAATVAAATGEAVTATGPIAQESARTVERRERYRQAQRKNRRNRILTTVGTGVAVILAVAAGAWIGAIVQIPDPPPAPSGQSAPENPAPTVQLFSAATAVVTCATTEEEVVVQLNWQVADANLVALAAGAAEIDAIDQPLQSELPLAAEAHAVPFPCAEETRTYTLTAAGADGSRTSASVVVARELVPVEEPEPEPVTPVTPARPVNPDPVVPEPAPVDPVPVDPTPVDPVPNPDPQPTTPEGEEQPGTGTEDPPAETVPPQETATTQP